MLRKNTSGQYVYFALVNATTGAALTGATVTGKRSIDGAAQGSVTGTITEDAGGQYHLALSQADTNGNDIGYLFTATNAIPVSIMVVTTAADPTDAVRFGLSALPSAPMMVKKNQALNNFMFPMIDATGASKTGLTVTAQRSLDFAALGNCANAVSELSNGIYGINLANTDLNANCIMFRFSSPGAQDTFYFLVTQP
jgi:hypothetical protein